MAQNLEDRFNAIVSFFSRRLKMKNWGRSKSHLIHDTVATQRFRRAIRAAVINRIWCPRSLHHRTGSRPPDPFKDAENGVDIPTQLTVSNLISLRFSKLMSTSLKVRPVGMPEITVESSKRWGEVLYAIKLHFNASMGNLATSSLRASQWVLSLSTGLTAILMPRSSHQRSSRQTLRRAASSWSSLQHLCGNATRPTKNR